MWNPQNQQRQGDPQWRGLALWPLLLLLMALVILYTNSLKPQARTEPIAYSTFLERVRAGVVEEVTIQDRKILGEWHDPAKPGAPQGRFVVNRPAGNLEQNLLDILSQHNVKFDAHAPSQVASAIYGTLFLVGMFLLFLMLMRRANPAERAMTFGKSRARQYVERDTKVTFTDVAGIEEPKQELEEIVDYLRHPEKFRRLGGRIPKGVLLVGAPGTGKTLLAKAVAGEAKVPFYLMSGSDFVELFVGVGASRVRDLFRQATANSPCIIFIDELDALGKARGPSIMSGGHDEREQTLNALLVEMDGFDSNTNVIVMGATNRPEILDPALMRPGRFDRQVMIMPPDVKGREQILRVHTLNIKMDPDVSLRRIAARTPGFVGADLANVVNEAALLAARRDRDRVTFDDFDEAIDRVSVGLERRSHVISEAEKKITAYHEAGHALVATFCEHADPVHKISIIPRGFAGGYTQYLPREDRHMVTRSQLLDWLAMGLGGRVAEELALGEISSGASNDIQRITDLARSMVVEFGMSDELGPINYESSGSRTDAYGMRMNGGKVMSEATAERIDAEVRRLIQEAHQRATSILTEHRDHLERLSLRLLEVETLDREEMHRLLDLPLPADHHGEEFPRTVDNVPRE